MCLIVHKPAGRRIAADFLQHVWQHNPHGWGLFRRESGRTVWAKGLALAELLVHNAHLPCEAEAWLHLRRATYGEVNHDMAHPHVVREGRHGGLLLMHNGSLHPLAPQDGRSDSAELARLLRSLLQGLDDEQAAQLLRSEGFARLLAPLVAEQAVVLLDHHGPVLLGRDWHTLQMPQWSALMQGIRVSNLHAWEPRDGSRQARADLEAIGRGAGSTLAGGWRRCLNMPQVGWRMVLKALV